MVRRYAEKDWIKEDLKEQEQQLIKEVSFLFPVSHDHSLWWSSQAESHQTQATTGENKINQCIMNIDIAHLQAEGRVVIFDHTVTKTWTSSNGSWHRISGNLHLPSFLQWFFYAEARPLQEVAFPQPQHSAWLLSWNSPMLPGTAGVQMFSAEISVLKKTVSCIQSNEMVTMMSILQPWVWSSLQYHPVNKSL